MTEENTENKVEFDDLLKEEPKKGKVEKNNRQKKQHKPNVPKAEVKPAQEQPKEEPKPKAKKKPYVHIDTFLQTAKGYFEITNVEAHGFKSKMNGRHYQREEQIFVDELKNYLNNK